MLQDSTAPSNGFTPRQVRILKISVIVMGVMLVLGIIALIFGMARQASRAATTGITRATFNSAYDIASFEKGAEIKTILATPAIVVLHIKTASGDVVLSYNPETGKEYGRMRSRPQ